MAGKIVLAGEYAVLDGCPALSLAINRGVGCHIQEGSGIVTPNGDTSFVSPFLAKKAQEKKYRFFDWNPVHEFGANKPGFGGSAAACVAACIAAGVSKEEAFAVHRSVQGSGSGIDVATSIHGGLIEYRNGTIQHRSPILPLIIWSGISAKTGPKVQQYLAWKERKEFVQECRTLIENFDHNPLLVFSELYKLLLQMAKVTNIAYQTPSIEKIVQSVQDFGGSAKPSGAGGGDCVVALFPDPHTEEDFQKKCPFPSIRAQMAPEPQIINHLERKMS